MLTPRGSVLGIDLGCSPTRKSSAACRLDWDETSVKWSIERFRAVEPERAQTIGRVAGNASLSAAAFDGPLRQGLDVIGRYRTAERMLTRRLQPLIGKPGQSSAPVGKLLNAHANDCARIVLDSGNLREARHSVGIHERAIAEAFPSSFLGVLIEQPEALNARRGDRSDTFFQHLATAGTFHKLIAHLLPGRSLAIHLSTVTNHDDRAALVCALTALCVAAGDFVAVGDDDGWIILPPVAFVQSWAIGLLETNAADEETIALHFEDGSRHSKQVAGSIG